LVVDCKFEGVQGDSCITVVTSAEALEAATKEQVTDEVTHRDPRLAEALQDVEVEVVAELGRVKMGLRDVLSVCVGQVIRLSTALDDPVMIRVAGIPKLTGVPVVSRGQLAIDVRGRIGS
jgi:flagellar motor switch protein FliM